MAQNAYVGVGNKAREVSKMYIGTPNTRANNVIKNGTLAETSAKWYIDSRMGVTQHAGYITVKANSTATSGTFPNYQLFESTISGSTQETNRVIFSAAMVRGRTTNTGTPRVYLRRYMNGTSTIQYVDLRVDSRTDSSSNLNDGNWHLVCSYDTTYWTNNYATYDRIAFGTNTTTTDDEMDICNVFVCDVTGVFGRGKEKDKNWLIDNLYYKAFSIIYNGALSSDYHNWTLSNGTATAVDNSIMLTPSSAGSRPEISQEFETIDPGNVDEIIFSCVEVKGSVSNTSCPTINMRPVTGGGIYQTTSFDGKSGLQINDGEWHPMGFYLKIGQNNTFKTMRTIRLCTTFDASMPTSTTDSYYFKNARVYNLTKIFGAGNEPTQTWCKENLVYGGYKDTNVIPTYFSSSIAPTDWVVSSDYYSAKAGNSYGEWQVIGENPSETNTIANGFDGDNSTYYYTKSRNGAVKVVYVRTPVYIKPSSIFIRYSWVDDECDIQGFNEKTNSWDILSTLTGTGSSILSENLSIDTQNFYNYFKINIWWSSSSGSNYSHLSEFRITSGYIDIYQVNYLPVPKTDMQTVAKKVVKAYIGVGGVAEQCYPSNKNYNGISFNGYTSNTLSEPRDSYGHSASAGQYALIMGGEDSSSLGYTNIVEAYNSNMTKSTLASLTYTRRRTSSTSFNNCAIICGGYGKLAGSSNSATYLNTYEYYDNNLSHTVGTIDYTVNRNAMANNGNFCLIAGGYGTLAPTLRPAVLALNKDMVKMVVGNISQGRQDLMGASFRNNAVFCGGMNTSSTYYTNIDVYDENFVHTIKYLPNGKRKGVACSTSDYLFIMGGLTSDTNAVDTTIIFDSNFVRSVGTPLSEGVGAQAGVSMPNFVSSICGVCSNNAESSIVETYNNSLVKATDYAGRAIGNVGCAISGNYVYVFGGSYYNDSSWSYTNSVQVFKLNY